MNKVCEKTGDKRVKCGPCFEVTTVQQTWSVGVLDRGRSKAFFGLGSQLTFYVAANNIRASLFAKREDV